MWQFFVVAVCLYLSLFVSLAVHGNLNILPRDYISLATGDLCIDLFIVCELLGHGKVDSIQH